MDKFSRSKFLKTVDIESTFAEKDLITNNIADFDFKRPMRFHTVTASEIGRPDMISFKNYNQVNLWWIIGKVNGVEDFFNDLQVGQVLRIPARADIDEMYLQNRKRNK